MYLTVILPTSLRPIFVCYLLRYSARLTYLRVIHFFGHLAGPILYFSLDSQNPIPFTQAKCVERSQTS
jgi:hypothetical protein